MRKLGGRATSAQIIAQAKIDYPDSSLWQYVGTRLTKMYEWGDIDFKDEIVEGKKKRVWFIVEHHEEDDGVVKKKEQVPQGMLFACSECGGRTFTTFAGLQQHRNKVH